MYSVIHIYASKFYDLFKFWLFDNKTYENQRRQPVEDDRLNGDCVFLLWEAYRSVAAEKPALNVVGVELEKDETAGG